MPTTAVPDYTPLLKFWFGNHFQQSAHSPEYEHNRRLWWGASKGIDDLLRERFGPLVHVVAEAVLTTPAAGGQKNEEEKATKESAAEPSAHPAGPAHASSLDPLHHLAHSPFGSWTQSPLGCLALILLLDQLPRNIFRGTARAFATDFAALAVARKIIEAKDEPEIPCGLAAIHIQVAPPVPPGAARSATVVSPWLASLAPAMQLFVCLVLEHAEDAAVVEQGVDLIDAVVASAPPQQASRMASQPRTFRVHLDMLRRFGRYPYRNVALGRVSTPEERAYLASKRLPTFARRTMGYSAAPPSGKGGGSGGDNAADDEGRMSMRQRLVAAGGNHRLALLRAAGITVADYSGSSGTTAPSKRGKRSGKQPAAAAAGSVPVWGKVLMLHGFRSGAKAFRKKTGKLRSKLAAVGLKPVYAQAPHAYELKGAALQDALEKFGGHLPDLSHQRVWWMASDVDTASDGEVDAGPDAHDDRHHFTAEATDTDISSTGNSTASHSTSQVPSRESLLSKRMRYTGVEESLTMLETELETKGPFVGVLGFAQGATMAALLVERLARKYGPRSSGNIQDDALGLAANGAKVRPSLGPLPFAVIISGYPPRDERFRARFEAGVVASLPGIGRSFHTWGLKDILIEPVRCEALLAAFRPAAKTDSAAGGSHGTSPSQSTVGNDDDPRGKASSRRQQPSTAESREMAVALPHSGAHYVPAIWPSDEIADFVRTFAPAFVLENQGQVGAEPDEQLDMDALKGLDARVEALLPQGSAQLTTEKKTAAVALFRRARAVGAACFSLGCGTTRKKMEQLIAKLAVHQTEVVDFVDALQTAFDTSGGDGGQGTPVTDASGFLDIAGRIGEEEVDVGGTGRLVNVLVDLALEAMGDAPLGDGTVGGGTTTSGPLNVDSAAVTTAAAAVLGAGAPPQASTSALEAKHRNRPPEELQALDFGLMLWLQARRIDPTHKRVAGKAALYRLTEQGGCGWPGLTRLFQLVQLIAVPPVQQRGHSTTTKKCSRATEIDDGNGAWDEHALQLPQLREAIVGLIGETLIADMHRCMPPAWCAYFTGKSRTGPPEDTTGEGPAQRAALAALGRINANSGNEEVTWPSGCALGTPTLGKAVDRECRLAHHVASVSVGHTQRYQQLVSALRAVLHRLSPKHLQQLATAEQQARAARAQNDVAGPVFGGREWRRRAALPISDAVLRPRPEPVVPARKEELEPLFQHLRTAEEPVKSIVRFKRGALVPDGRLDLCKQVVGPEGVGPLCKALAQLVEGVDLGLNHQSGPAPSAQPVGHSVTRLLLGNNIVGNGGARDIAELIRSGRSSITTWYIAGNDFSADGIAHVCEALAHDTQVDMLWLKRNPLLPAGGPVLAKLLRTNRMIHTLDLDNTGLLDEGAIVVLKSLAENGGTLRHLYLNGNGLGQATAEVIAEVLAPADETAPPCALLTLMAGSNRWGDQGAIAISRGLKHNNTIMRLSLQSSRIGLSGASALASAVAHHSSLASLNLGFAKATAALGELGNGIGDGGAKAFAVALRTNTSLRELDLIHNGISQKGVDFLLAALGGAPFSDEPHDTRAFEPNTKLLTLRIASWGITRNDIAQQEMAAYLERNQALCTADEVQLAAEAHMPKHVRDIYSVYRVE